MKDAIKDLAEGNFGDGLCKLNQNNQWCDEKKTLDGPFYLGFPCAPGWGEGLLLASLLKRYATYFEKQIDVFAQEQVRSILKQDRAFNVQPAEDIKQARSCGARSPLAILAAALTGDLLQKPVEMIDAGADKPKHRGEPCRIGISWASMKKNGKQICDKSIPLEEFLSILGDVDAEIISFQRKLDEDDCNKLNDRYRGRFSTLSNNELDAMDQSVIVGKIRGLDCMVTISTTTAHIAAGLGVPVVLLAAKRPWQQWFWRAQKEHGKCFYPQTDVVLGGTGSKWWKGCITPAGNSFNKRIQRPA